MEINTRKEPGKRTVTLISNWDLKHHYKENMPNDFIQKLVEPLVLDGDWEVAMPEISFPLHILNVKTPIPIMIRIPDVSQNHEVVFRIPSAYYATPKALGDALITHYDDAYGAQVGGMPRALIFSYDFETARSSLYTESGKLSIITESPDFFDMLGFAPTTAVNGVGVRPIFCLEVSPSRTPARRPPALNIYQHMLIDVDVIEPQMVGDMLVQQIARLGINKTMRGQVDYAFPHLNYVPVCRNHIDTIRLRLLTELGEPFPAFGGHVVAKLYFRKRGLLD